MKKRYDVPYSVATPDDLKGTEGYDWLEWTERKFLLNYCLSNKLFSKTGPSVQAFLEETKAIEIS